MGSLHNWHFSCPALGGKTRRFFEMAVGKPMSVFHAVATTLFQRHDCGSSHWWASQGDLEISGGWHKGLHAVATKEPGAKRYGVCSKIKLQLVNLAVSPYITRRRSLCVGGLLTYMLILQVRVTKGKLASGSVVPRPEILKQRRVPLPLIGEKVVDAPNRGPKP